VGFGYDGDGLRTTKTAGATTASFAYDRSRELPLILSDGSNNYVYGPGGTPIEQISAVGAATYLHVDQLGSVRLLTNASGAAAGKASYSPYGKVTHTGTTTPFGFAGQYTDAETGLVWMRARYYDPSSGQFLGRDPLSPTTRSAYGYVEGDPINGLDPTGLCGFRCAVHWGYEHSSEIAAAADTVALVTAAVPGLDVTVAPVAGAIGLTAGAVSAYRDRHDPVGLGLDLASLVPGAGAEAATLRTARAERSVFGSRQWSSLMDAAVGRGDTARLMEILDMQNDVAGQYRALNGWLSGAGLASLSADYLGLLRAHCR
jgi:RHS repeat-associated protein